VLPKGFVARRVIAAAELLSVYVDILMAAELRIVRESPLAIPDRALERLHTLVYSTDVLS
jgi:hypothetical protein